MSNSERRGRLSPLPPRALEQRAHTELTPAQQFERRKQTPGVSETLEAFTWLESMLGDYVEHFPEGALDSLAVGEMCHAYALENPDKYDARRRVTLTAAAFLHDIGKLHVPKGHLESNTVYSKEERLDKLSLHVEEGIRLVVDQQDKNEIDYTGVDKDRVRIALILGGHHLDQDDRGSYPPADVSWLLTGDVTILEDRKVLQAADRVEALRSKRSYKAALSEEETKDYLENQGNNAVVIDFMLAAFATREIPKIAA